VVERWLARLSASPHADKFVVTGGMLLAALTVLAEKIATAIALGPANTRVRANGMRGRIMLAIRST
jgi:hypothetical protein